VIGESNAAEALDPRDGVRERYPVRGRRQTADHKPNWWYVTGRVLMTTGIWLRSLVRGNMHAGFWSRGGQSALSIDCNWSLLRSWLRPHRGISQEKLPVYLGFFEFVHNVRKRGKALLPALIELLVT